MSVQFFFINTGFYFFYWKAIIVYLAGNKIYANVAEADRVMRKRRVEVNIFEMK